MYREYNTKVMINITRREFIKTAGIGTLAASLGSCLKQERIDKPNVLFIAIDDLNDWSSVLKGHPQAKTPNLERLAQRGINFTNAYTAAACCNPSRTALLTGQSPYQTGIYENWVPWREYLPDAVTIPQYFTKHGYWSAGAGKIFHNSFPDPQSWENYFPSKTKHFPPYIYPDDRPVNMPYYEDMYVEFDWWGHDQPDEETGDFKSVQWVGRHLLKEHERPFFLACGLYRPHLPWFVPKKYFDQFPLDSIQLPETKEDDLDDLPEAALKIIERQKVKYHDRVMKHGKWKEAVQAYLASIAYADAMLGRLLDYLDSGPNADNTIILLWSDHGWHLGEKTHWRKYALWENVANVHFMISVPPGTPGLPHGTKNGLDCRRTVSLQDIYPTLLELCGLPPRGDIAGNSLAPLLRQPNRKWKFPAITSIFTGDLAVSWENWRYLRYQDGGEELYDLSVDPHEWTNVADDPKFSKIKALLKSRLPEDPSPKVQRKTN